MAYNLLIVDDEARLRDLLRAYLARAGYGVATAADGEEALALVRKAAPDLIVLDIMMPRMDGLDFMRAYQRLCSERAGAPAPIIYLTARVDELDRVVGLELGADDYITKPFSPRVLVARIEAVLRRYAESLPCSNALQVGDVILDPDCRQVRVGARPVRLTRSEFDLLATLMAAPGRVFSRDALLRSLQVAYTVDHEGAHGSGAGCARTIDVHVTNLRAKIERNPHEPRYIETVYGEGYRFARE